MTSMFKKSALGLALAVVAIASNAPAQARDTYQRDNGNGYRQVRHDDRGNRSERHHHLTRRDEYRIRNHHNGGERNHESDGRRGY